MTAASLAPWLKAQFNDNNGNPLYLGQLFTYAAGTNTPIATYVDSTGTTQNTNPIILNTRGEANVWLIANTGYKFVLEDSFENVIWTEDNVFNQQLLSLYGGVDTGVVNAAIINFASPVPANTNGQFVIWFPAFSNTGPTTINVNGGGPQPILNPNGTQLGANQLLAGQAAAIIELNGIWQLYGGSGVGVNVGTFGAEVPLPSATTTDLGSVSGHNVAITGTTTITSFGTSAQLTAPIYIGRFTGSLTLTNSASLILPGGNNIVTTAGDSFLAEYFGSGNWRVLSYDYASQNPLILAVKGLDTGRLSTTTLAADPDLQVTLSLGQYSYELFLLFDAVSAGAGFKFSADGSATDSRSTSPAVATGIVNASAYGPKLESFLGATISYSTLGTGTDSNGVLYKGSLLVSGAGTFGIQWAQVSSTASNTTLRAGSYLAVTPLAQKTGNSPTQRIYTSGTGTETIPANVTTCVIEVFGASGGGGSRFNAGGGNFSGGGGAGSGGYSRTSVTVSGHSGQTMTYSVGAAGAPGAAGGTTTVVAGTFSLTTMTANTGAAGGNAPSGVAGGTGGAGGTASGGTAVNTSGNGGSAGTNVAGGGLGGAGGTGVPGIYAGGNAGAAGTGPAGIGNSGGAGIIAFTYT